MIEWISIVVGGAVELVKWWWSGDPTEQKAVLEENKEVLEENKEVLAEVKEVEHRLKEELDELKAVERRVSMDIQRLNPSSPHTIADEIARTEAEATGSSSTDL